MRLAYVTAAEKGRTDRVLAEVAEALLARGVKAVGVVQTNIDRPQRFHCDMDLTILPDGPVIGITQNLGPNARGCRLDSGALETAVGAVARRLAEGPADVLILNKFGKQEAEGHGFRDVIAEALAMGLPVILGVNGLNASAFDTFACGIAEALPADAGAILDWLGGTAAIAA